MGVWFAPRRQPWFVFASLSNQAVFGAWTSSSSTWTPSSHLLVEEFSVPRPAEEILEAPAVEMHHAQLLRRTRGHDGRGVRDSHRRRRTANCGSGRTHRSTRREVSMEIPKGIDRNGPENRRDDGTKEMVRRTDGWNERYERYVTQSKRRIRDTCANGIGREECHARMVS